MANGSSPGSRRMRWRLAGPDEAVPAHQVRQRAARASSGRPHSHSGTSIAASCALCGSRLTATRIMSSRAGARLAVEQDLVVEGVDRSVTPRWLCSAGIAPADAVERGDLGHDVAGRVQVAHARISYFSESRYSSRPGSGARLAQLEARIHAPQAGQRRGQRGADQEARRGPMSAGRCGLMSGVLTKKCGRKNSRTGASSSARSGTRSAPAWCCAR